MTFLDTKRAYDIALGVAFISPHFADIGERRESDLGKQFPSALGSTAIIKRLRVLRIYFYFHAAFSSFRLKSRDCLAIDEVRLTPAHARELRIASYDIDRSFRKFAGSSGGRV